MRLSKSQSVKSQTQNLRKLLLGCIGIAAAAVISSAGIAAAAPLSDNGISSTPSVTAFCKTHYKQLGFSNIGQCVSHLNGHGHGYGGGDNDHDFDHHHHHHFHFHNFFGNWWHHYKHDF